jgi:hypothetical protein
MIAFCATASTASVGCVVVRPTPSCTHNKNITDAFRDDPASLGLCGIKGRNEPCRNWRASSAQSRSAACFSRSRLSDRWQHQEATNGRRISSALLLFQILFHAKAQRSSRWRRSQSISSPHDARVRFQRRAALLEIFAPLREITWRNAAARIGLFDQRPTLHHVADIFEHAHISERIALHGNQVGKAPWCDTAKL